MMITKKITMTKNNGYTEDNDGYTENNKDILLYAAVDCINWENGEKISRFREMHENKKTIHVEDNRIIHVHIVYLEGERET